MGRFRRPSTGIGAHPFRLNEQMPTADIELMKDLFEEGVQLYGDPLIYIQKEFTEEEATFGEHLIETMKDVHHFFGFVEQVEGWEGTGEMFSKFGIRSMDEMTIHVPKNTFFDLGFVPKFGDLIYHVVSKKLWEIEDVKDDKDYSFMPLSQYVAYIFGMKAYRFDHVEAGPEFQQSEDEHIQTINEVLFGDGTVQDNAHDVEIEQKNDKLDAEIIEQDIIDDSENDPIGLG